MDHWCKEDKLVINPSYSQTLPGRIYVKIKQFSYDVDSNLGYLIYGDKTAFAIDPGAVEETLAFADDQDLRITMVANTHSHGDHLIGNEAVLNASGAEYLDNRTLRERKTIPFEDGEISVHHTPGHSEDCLIFHFEDTLVTGDTLLIGKVGRCFTGDLKSFYKSVQLIMSLPGKTVIYPGHDYVEEYMEYARNIEPDNTDIDKFMNNYSPEHVYSTLDQEMKINIHLRFNDDKMISILKKKGLATGTEYERWEGVMSL